MAASNSNHRGTSGAGIQIGSAWFQRKINLRPQHRGVHLVTEEILRQMPELGQFSVGLCHVQSKKIAFLLSNVLLSCSTLRFNKIFKSEIQVSNFNSIVFKDYCICNNAQKIVSYKIRTLEKSLSIYT